MPKFLFGLKCIVYTDHWPVFQNKHTISFNLHLGNIIMFDGDPTFALPDHALEFIARQTHS
jgi:hypothetical protein